MSTLERLERANPVPDADRLLTAPGAMDGFILAVQERSGIVQTTEDRAPIEVPTIEEAVQPPARPAWSRRLIPVLGAAAAAIVAVVLAVVIMSGDGESDDVTGPIGPESSSLEVVEAFIAAQLATDRDAMEALVADPADLGPGINLDTVDRVARYVAATGAEWTGSCEELSGFFVLCTTTWYSGLVPGQLLSVEETLHRVEDGLIVSIGPGPTTSVESNFVDSDRANLNDYRSWMEETDREAFDELFVFGTIRLETDELITRHQEMIARFIASDG